MALWIAATPIFANWLNLRLESQVPPVSLEMLPESDVVILLGDVSCSRIMRALRIYRAGKAPLIVISGGNLPWQAAVVPEAQRIANVLVEFGAPRSALIRKPEAELRGKMPSTPPPSSKSMAGEMASW